MSSAAGTSKEFYNKSHRMRFLSIDTSTKYSVAAFIEGERIIFGESRLYEKGRLDGLDLLIHDALKRTKLDVSDLDGFGIGIGPGSFTGLRIGVSTIKGLSYCLDKPVYGFSSLDAICYSALGADFSKLCVLVDARRLNVYCRMYKKTKNIERVTEDRLLPFENLLDSCDKNTVFCGDGAGVYEREIVSRFGKDSILAQKFWFPTPESIAALTLEYCKNKESKDSFELSARYLYGQDCQVASVCGKQPPGVK